MQTGESQAVFSQKIPDSGVPQSTQALIIMQIKMYTKSYCSFCYAAKSLLTKRGLDFEEISLSDNVMAEQQMLDLTGRSTVPQILIDDKPIGGYTELVEMDMDGEL